VFVTGRGGFLLSGPGEISPLPSPPQVAEKGGAGNWARARGFRGPGGPVTNTS